VSNPHLYYFLTPPISDSIPPVGSLQDIPSYALLLWVARERFTGRLILEREKRVKHLFFSKGELTAIRSNLIMEGIDMVLKRGFLDPQFVVQIQQDIVSGTMEEDWEDRMILHLLSKDYIKEEKLKEALDIQVFEQLLNAMGWLEGKYFLKPMEAIPQRFLFHPVQIQLSDFSKKLDVWLRIGSGGFIPPAMLRDFHPQGELGSCGGGGLLFQVAHLKKNGRLILKRGRKRKNFLFKDGKIFSVSTSDPKETLEEILLKWKFLPKDIIQSVATQARLSGTRLRSSLLSQKLMQENELIQALKLLHLERILETFSWRSGQYEWVEFLEEEKDLIIDEERTNAESSKSIRNHSQVMYQFAKSQGHRNIVIVESKPLENDDREIIFQDFLEFDSKIVAVVLHEEGTFLEQIEHNRIQVSYEQLGKWNEKQQQDWYRSLVNSYDTIVWFTPITQQVPVKDHVCHYLLLDHAFLSREKFREQVPLKNLPKLQGYFLLQS